MSQNPLSPPPRSRRFSRAFSLVEVTLALGIVAFTVVSLMGVMPIALNTYKSAMDSSLRANMLRKISSELKQAPFDSVDSAKLKDRFFNDQGMEVAEKDAIYRVHFSTVGDKTSIFGSDNPSLKPVTVEILSALAQNQPPMGTVTIFVPDNGFRAE